MSRADEMMHPNMCSFIKAVLEEFSNGGYDGLVLTNCCDSARRLYDVLSSSQPGKFFHLVDVPRRVSGGAAKVYEKEVLSLAEAYSEHFGVPYS